MYVESNVGKFKAAIVICTYLQYLTYLLKVVVKTFCSPSPEIDTSLVSKKDRQITKNYNWTMFAVVISHIIFIFNFHLRSKDSLNLLWPYCKFVQLHPLSHMISLWCFWCPNYYLAVIIVDVSHPSFLWTYSYRLYEF